MPFGVYSEVGRLRRVITHRPGLEHTRLTPSNAGELLFDDVIWVARAKSEHDMFCEVMRDRGVEVFLAEQLLAEALGQAGAREWVSGHILSERQVGITAAARGREWAMSAEAPPHHQSHPRRNTRITPRPAPCGDAADRERRGWRPDAGRNGPPEQDRIGSLAESSALLQRRGNS
jgi:arginine deiminase